MAHILEHDRTGLFSVVGAAPVAEQHQDVRSHYHLDSISGTTGAFVAGVWFALYAAIVVAAILGKGGVGRIVETITAALIH
jgi:hypothetical protein